MKRGVWFAVIGFCALLDVRGTSQSKEASAFTAYTACTLSEGLGVVETAPLAPEVRARSVKTLTGNYSVAIEEGRRVMFAYPGEDFFANVKVEVLPQRWIRRFEGGVDQ